MSNDVTAPVPNTAPLTLDELAELRSLFERVGIIEATRRLRMSRSTLTAIAAGLNLREGTRVIYRERLAAAKARGEV